jgi:hypothetical protein
MKKRVASPFSLAFLDIMFCGFGAVVLLVMILNGEVLRKREAQAEDLRGELSRATALEEFARSHLAEIKKQVKEAELEEGDVESRVQTLQKKIGAADQKRSAAERKAREIKSTTARIEQQKSALENATRILKSKSTDPQKPGDQLAGFTGDGQRQYLTGLKLGGKRTLILFDISASMLDETIVNIIRRKLMNPEIRRQSPKWQRAVRTLHWLIANLKQGTQFQVYAFNTVANSVVPGTDGRWLDSSKAADLAAALAGARTIAPEGGTSLHRAFNVASHMSPRPDSIILVTDGLPTQGLTAVLAGQVTSDEREALFNSAVASLPKAIPVNTLLFPIEGDPLAAVSFWKLAIKSKGSFITPSRDWP